MRDIRIRHEIRMIFFHGRFPPNKHDYSTKNPFEGRLCVRAGIKFPFFDGFCVGGAKNFCLEATFAPGNEKTFVQDPALHRGATKQKFVPCLPLGKKYCSVLQLQAEAQMSYEVLERQIRTLPEEALEDVSIYLDKIGKIYRANKAVDFSFVDDIFGTLSDSEADALRSCCGLTFREDA